MAKKCLSAYPSSACSYQKVVLLEPQAARQLVQVAGVQGPAGVPRWPSGPLLFQGSRCFGAGSLRRLRAARRGLRWLWARRRWQGLSQRAGVAPCKASRSSTRAQRHDGMAAGAPAEVLRAARLDYMLELADVARPVVTAAPPGPRPDGAGCAAPGGRVLLQKAPGQQQHIVANRAAAVSVRGRPTGGGTGRHRKTLAATRSRRWRLVAATTRTFTRRARRRPGAGFRRSAACAAGLHAQGQLAHFIEETACAVGCLEAPGPVGHRAEKAPRRWPTAHCSASDSGSAAQLTCTSGLCRRGEWRCSRRANGSLPAGPAQQQNRQVRGGDQLHLVQQAPALRSGPGFRSSSSARAQRWLVGGVARRRGCRRGSGPGSPAPGGSCGWPPPRTTAQCASAARAAASKVPVCSASSVSTPQGRPSMRSATPMQSCTGGGSPTRASSRPS